MAIQINPRTAIIAGVAVLAAAGAGAWFFLFEEDAPPPPVAATKTVAAVKDAAKAAEGAPKAAAPGAPAAAPGAAAQPPKPAAAKPAAIPTDPDKLVVEIIDTSGMRAQIRSFATEVASSANSASQQGQEGPSMDPRAVAEIAAKHFEADSMMTDLVQGLKASYEAERMGRFLELLRQPLALKMSAIEGRPITREERAQFAENFRKNPPSAARQKLILTIDEVTRSSELGLHIATLTAREMVDALFEGMQKAGKRPPKESRQLLNSQIGAAEPQIRAGFRTLLHITYRDVGDEELAEYVKLLESETGRWGSAALANALRPAVEKRIRPFARDIAGLALQQVAARSAPRGDAAAAPVAKEEKKEPPRAVVAAAPAEAPGYKRPAGIRQLYSRHNDIVTAVVMRDAASVKELLADGKNPNTRQSDGFTPLMIAASNGDATITQMLLAGRADPGLRTPDGQTALSLARKNNAAQVVQLLERSGARN